MEELIKEIAVKNNLKVSDITGKRRPANIVVARSEFCYRAYYELKYNYSQIGSFLNRTHATIIHLVKIHTAARKPTTTSQLIVALEQRKKDLLKQVNAIDLLLNI